MDIFKTLLLFTAVQLCTTLLYGQAEEVFKTDTAGLYKLSDIVVSATKTDNSTLKLASSISIIDSTEIANRKKLNVFDLIKFEYGLNSLQFGPLGGLSTISIRGANAGQSLVLLDGVEMNLPSAIKAVIQQQDLSSDEMAAVMQQIMTFISRALATVIIL